MQRLILLFLLLLNFNSSIAQFDSTIFGLARKTIPNSFFFAKINTTSGLVTNISGASITNCVNVTGSASTIDPIKHEFYYRDCSNQFVTVNMTNGNISNSQLITNILTPSFGFSNYNCHDSVIYGLANSTSPNAFYFSKINPLNGIVTNISISSIANCVNATGATLNSKKAEFYFENCTNQFITVDINTGAIINTQTITNTNGSGFSLFKYNCSDSTIYGLSIKNSPNQVFLAKINPLTGVVTNISSTSVSNNINLTSSTIDPIKKQFYFENSSNQFIAVDLASGNIVSNPVITNSNGNYFDLFKYNNGCCCNTETINLGLDKTLCENDTLVLSPNLSNSNVIWQDNSTTPNFTVTQQGTYWVKTSSSGCFSSDTVKIFYNPLPIVNLGNDTALCQGDNIVLSTNNLNSSFVWQDNSNNSNYVVTQQGYYWVNVTTNDCSNSDSINVYYNSLPVINLGNDTTLCTGNSLVLNASTSNANYIWQNNSTSSTFLVTQTGHYWVQVTSNGCSSSDSINVSINDLPVVNLGNNIELCSGATITLNATNPNATYLWQDNSTTPTYTVTQPGIYWVSVTKNNCNNSDSINVNIINCGINLEMPNVFTPNNDHANDNFIPKNANGISNASLSIFNRWGQLLFQTTDLTKGWDGKINNNDSPAGTYYWIFSYTTIKNENKTLNGFLTLTR